MKNFKQKGLVLINVLVFGVITVIVTTALINWAGIMIKNIRNLSNKEQAIQIAEAGIDYYRWHLAHAPTDYKDGYATTTNGPFYHDYKDKDGNVIGKFALTITPPAIGSTLTTIKSVGTVDAAPGISRAIQVSLAIPSFARFAVIANDFMNFGVGTEIFGPIHSNNGVHFSGLAHNIITSAKDKFIDPDLGTHNPAWYQMGVYTSVGPTEENHNSTPPTSPPNRTDVFIAGRQFPVSVVDFLGITTDLAKMKADAISNGKYYASSGLQGYHLILKTNDTFDLYKVKAQESTPNNCSNVQNEDDWGTWSIDLKNGVLQQTVVATNVPFPANGVMFFEDHVWVEGQINTARLTIAAGRFPDNPTTWRNIIVNKDLKYTNFDGQDIIALVAQGNVSTGLYAGDGSENLTIDAAIIAQNGRVGRNYYQSGCGSTYILNQLNLYGMIGTNHRYGFAWGSINSISSGFQTRNITYDANLLYSPPPNFPLTSNQYTIVSWEEVE